jgi:hypothetical protein
LSAVLAWNIGFFGVVLATLVEMSLFYGVAVPLLVSKVLRVRLRDYYLVLGKPLLKIGWILPVLLVLGRRFSEPDYLRLLSVGSLIVAAFAIASAFLLTTAPERRQLLGRIQTRFKP